MQHIELSLSAQNSCPNERRPKLLMHRIHVTQAYMASAAALAFSTFARFLRRLSDSLARLSSPYSIRLRSLRFLLDNIIFCLSRSSSSARFFFSAFLRMAAFSSFLVGFLTSSFLPRASASSSR
ncbi:ribosome biogenesis protein Pescadillo [Alternaria sp. MG1]|nr:ribosome biogenesis protein Pescadillo [Alternaria sp. MG1]